MAKVDINPNISNALREAVDDAAFWRLSNELPRTYLGISIIGHPCVRYLWLNFRWFSFELFSGRMYRLFRRGKHEEETIVEDLRGAGIDIEHVFGIHMRRNIDKSCRVVRRIEFAGADLCRTQKHDL